MQTIQEFTLTNSQGSKVNILNLGAIVKNWYVPTENGEIDIILGFNNKERYLEKHPSFGVIVGRYANRIANAEFILNGKRHHLDANNGKNHIHGGNSRFGNHFWELVDLQDNSVSLKYISPDGESSYPGELSVQVSYTLTESNELTILYYAISSEDTICNLTNHAYFNLNGESSGEVFDHDFQIHSSHFLPIDKGGIPTGVYQDVRNTAMDLQTSKKLGRQEMLNDPLFKFTKGYDHNYILGRKRSFKKAATISSEKSRLKLECFTDKPGIQFYLANSLSNIKSKQNKEYSPYHGFCLEAQFFPDSPNKSYFPSSVLQKGDQYQQKTVYKLSSLDS